MIWVRMQLLGCCQGPGVGYKFGVGFPHWIWGLGCTTQYQHRLLRIVSANFCFVSVSLKLAEVRSVHNIMLTAVYDVLHFGLHCKAVYDVLCFGLKL